MTTPRHPPSPRKLQRARDRGDLPVSARAVRTAAFLTTLLTLLIALPHLSHALSALAYAAWSLPSLQHAQDVLLPPLTQLTGWLAFILVTPALIALLTGLIQTRFQLAPAAITQRSSPFALTARLRQRLSLRHLAPRLIAWPFAALTLAATMLLFAYALPELLAFTASPPPETLAATRNFAILLALAFAAVALPIALFDLWLTHRLYLRAHRMTDAEKRHEERTLQAPPELARERRRRARELARARHFEPHQIVLALHAPQQHLTLLIAYDPPHLNTPCLAEIASGPRAHTLLDRAPVVDVPDLTRQIARTVPPGHPIPSRFHDALVELLAENPSALNTSGSGASS